MNNIKKLIDVFEQLKKNKFIIESIDPEFFFRFGENIIQENKELKEKLEEKDMQHKLELIGKEEYTKDAMGEIIEHYYTANEDCIPKSKVKEELEDIIDYFEHVNVPDEDIEFLEKKKQELLEEGE